MKCFFALLLCWLAACTTMPPSNYSEFKLPRVDALRYAQAYARSYNLPITNLKTSPEGSFCGKLGPLDFEYRAKEGLLLIRAVVLNNASGLQSERNKDIRAELERVSKDEPTSVNGATFEIVKLPWEEYPNASLYLRMRVITPGLRDDQFVQQAEQLSKTAYQWHRLYFQQLAERVIHSHK